MFQIEYEFELPRGYVDRNGNLHKKGVMRLATAADEIFPLKDPRVIQNPAYLSIIILSRVIIKLGTLGAIDTLIIENMFSADLNFLQDFYSRINDCTPAYTVDCPHCKEQFELPINFFTQGR